MKRNDNIPWQRNYVNIKILVRTRGHWYRCLMRNLALGQKRPWNISIITSGTRGGWGARPS